MNIQTHTSKIHSKPKKKGVQNIIEKLYSNTDDVELRKELAEIYKFFMPAIPKRTESQTEWAFKACSKGKHAENRPQLKYTYSLNGYLYGIDGQRMHWIKTELPEGFYDQNGKSIDNYGYTFPAVERLTHNNEEPLVRENIIISDLAIENIKGVMCYMISDRYYNKVFIDDAINGEPTAIAKTFEDINSSIQLIVGDKKAIIMPIRIN